jgi:hypothetical protein
VPENPSPRVWETLIGDATGMTGDAKIQIVDYKDPEQQLIVVRLINNLRFPVEHTVELEPLDAIRMGTQLAMLGIKEIRRIWQAKK